MYQSFTYQVDNGIKRRPYRDLTQAVSDCHGLDSISVNLNQTVVVEFQTIHELIGDILRNPCQHYKIVAVYCDSCDELTKVINNPDADIHTVFQFILKT